MVRHLKLLNLVLVFLLLGATQALAEKRYALIIGNSAYTYSGGLENPVNDARLLAAALRRSGFEVTVHTDATQKAILDAFRAHTARLKAAGPTSVGLFYYSGHGTQVNGQNYILPVDANIENEAQVESAAVSASGLMAQLEGAGNKMNIVIFDSCRNNPFKRGYRAQVRGLAPMHAPPSTLIAYSTQPGNVAYDGSSGYSPYAIALQRAIRLPGIPLEKAFKHARTEVNDTTEGKQVPWEESSLFVDFYFNKEPPAEDITPTAWDLGAFDTEAALWKDIRSSRDPGAFRSYLKTHPKGTFALLATDRAGELEELAAAAATAPAPASIAGVYFLDEFDGNELSSDWDVMNPDPDAFIVEDGRLTVLLTDTQKPTMETTPNIFRLLKPLPKGNWTATVKIDFAPQTMSEWLQFGLFKRDGTGLATALQVSTNDYGRATHFYLRGDKIARKTSSFYQDLYVIRVKQWANIRGRTEQFSGKINSVLLRLEKTGRRYITSGKFIPVDPNDDKAPAREWVSLSKLTSLRIPGDKFTLILRTTRNTEYLPKNTEGLVNIDWIRIETPGTKAAGAD